MMKSGHSFLGVVLQFSTKPGHEEPNFINTDLN